MEILESVLPVFFKAPSKDSPIIPSRAPIFISAEMQENLTNTAQCKEPPCIAPYKNNHPSATSSIIITRNPTINPRVPDFSSSPAYASGISS